MRMAIGLLLAVSSRGQTTINYNVPPGLPEDSPVAAERNLIFYDNPHGLQPQTGDSGPVTVDQLQHPLSNKGLKLLRKADQLSESGHHENAIAQLQAALKEPSAVPYAHSMLGQEYLKLHQIPAAVAELKQAVALLPRNAATRSNLAYALLLSGDLERGEQEARQALNLDRANPKTSDVLNQILAARRAQEASR